MRNFDHTYQKRRDYFGSPYVEFQHLAETIPPASKVLDLGCGQGRDSLFLAARGHSVTGVDLSAEGISHMEAAASDAGLQVRAVVSDLSAFEPEGQFDLVVLDMVLHFFKQPGDQERMIGRALDWVAPGGALWAVTPTKDGTKLINKTLRPRAHQWEVTHEGRVSHRQKVWIFRVPFRFRVITLWRNAN